METELRDLRDSLDQRGLTGELEFLNQRVPHRFTGVYRLNQRILTSVCLVDKRGDIPPPSLKKIPLGDSFCQFVLDEGMLVTDSSADEPLLNGHRYQGVLHSYMGLPLCHIGDDPEGTLCHFDFERVHAADAEFGFLRKAAVLLQPYLPQRS